MGKEENNHTHFGEKKCRTKHVAVLEELTTTLTTKSLQNPLVNKLIRTHVLLFPRLSPWAWVCGSPHTISHGTRPNRPVLTV